MSTSYRRARQAGLLSNLLALALLTLPLPTHATGAALAAAEPRSLVAAARD
ncbi:hypothetical protein ACIGKL_01045 [Pseudomonas sp. NPDC077186]|uniref:hypothetical protein n=1 Tax=Pseudomonas sp. NPDC077186 TaxID=3364421 RepID=UPI0037C7AA2D